MAILSIQSHVVYGYAGNTAAVFPLQRSGHEVWAVNTVEFSNHTGYKSWRGQVLGGELAEELIKGVEERGGLPRCEAVLSGYLGDATVANAIKNTVKKVRSANPSALYCCDPVMGDVGRGFYVKSDIPEIIKNELIPIADIICPNHFELEALAGTEIKNIETARSAIESLHEKGPKVILVTSFKGNVEKGKIGLLASDKTGLYSITTQELPISVGMAGSGDITTAIFLARYLETRDVKKTLERCTASIFGIIEKSWHAHNSSMLNPALMELRITQEQNELVNPSRHFEAKKVF